MIKDFKIRVWDNDVFINTEGLNYWGNVVADGTKTNYDADSNENKKISELCDDIRIKIFELSKLIKE